MLPSSNGLNVLLLVALVWAWVRREWGEMPAFTTSILLTLSWWSIIFSRIGLRPILMPVLIVLAAWHWQKTPMGGGRVAGVCHLQLHRRPRHLPTAVAISIVLMAGSKPVRVSQLQASYHHFYGVFPTLSPPIFHSAG